MESQVHLFRVFIASPSDLGDERRVAREVVEELNSIFSKETEIRIELLGWEDTLPGSGRPQALINADLDKADLFVGCLWQKMGSPSGAVGKTGFEEEFYRALARNHSTGTPEMWLFLKELDAARLADPGEHLQKVLEFRKEQIESKQLLFKEFKDAGSWRELIRSLLLRRLLQAVTSQTTVTKEEQASGNAPAQRQAPPEAETSAKKPSTPKPDDTALAELLELAAAGIRENKLLAYDKTTPLPPASTARLLLFAATNYDWNAQHIEFGTHEINSTYWHRKSIKLTGHEILFVLRTILLDSNQTKPGWYWLSQRKSPISGWLTYLTTQDSDAAMRLAAIKLATRIAFPLGKGNKKTRPIKRILSDSDADVRIAGLNFLSAHGIASDRVEIEALLADTNKDVRTAAERSSRILKLRHSPEIELLRILREKDTFDKDLVEILEKRKSDISDDTLREALLHQSLPLRSFAAQELFDRNELTKDSAICFTTDESRRIRQIGYTFLALSGETISQNIIEEALQSSDYFLDEPSWTTGDAKPVFSAMLTNMSDSDLWHKIITFDDQSALAATIFGKRSKKSVGQLRKLINEGFDDLAAQAPKRSNSNKTSNRGFLSLLLPSDPIEAAKEEIRSAVLEILANDPTAEDRHIFLRHLAPDRSKRTQLLASLNGLMKVGTADDLPKISPFLASNYNPIEKAASMAFLRLSPNPISAASELLSVPTKIKVWAIVMQALEAEDQAVWTILEPLLANEDDDIRRISCYFALKTKSKKQISELLEAYLKRKTYYYSVVVILDRHLYAPQSIADLHIEEELKWANQWG
jgi:hypothetical protein